MRSRSTVALCTLSLVLGIALSTNVSVAAESDASFKTIFNGKDLKGWEGDSRFWSVRDGAITGQTTENSRVRENNFLIWQGGDVADFEIRLKFKLIGGNSGIYYHSKKRAPGAKGEALVGPQADFSADHKWTGDIMEYTLRDILAERGEKIHIGKSGKKHLVGTFGDPEVLLKFYNEKDWNEYRVLTEGGLTTLWINGKKMCELIDEDPRRPKSGLLALQVHVGPPMLVQFKAIRLRQIGNE